MNQLTRAFILFYFIEGHEENEDHNLKKTFDITMICKKCRKAFRKDLSDFDETDQYCPNCDNEYVLPSVGVQKQIEQERALQQEQSLRDQIMNEHLNKLNNLDARYVQNSIIYKRGLCTLC